MKEYRIRVRSVAANMVMFESSWMSKEVMNFALDEFAQGRGLTFDMTSTVDGKGAETEQRFSMSSVAVTRYMAIIIMEREASAVEHKR